MVHFMRRALAMRYHSHCSAALVTCSSTLLLLLCAPCLAETTFDIFREASCKTILGMSDKLSCNFVADELVDVRPRSSADSATVGAILSAQYQQAVNDAIAAHAAQPSATFVLPGLPAELLNDDPDDDGLGGHEDGWEEQDVFAAILAESVDVPDAKVSPSAGARRLLAKTEEAAKHQEAPEEGTAARSFSPEWVRSTPDAMSFAPVDNSNNANPVGQWGVPEIVGTAQDGNMHYFRSWMRNYRGNQYVPRLVAGDGATAWGTPLPANKVQLNQATSAAKQLQMGIKAVVERYISEWLAPFVNAAPFLLPKDSIDFEKYAMESVRRTVEFTMPAVLQVCACAIDFAANPLAALLPNCADTRNALNAMNPKGTYTAATLSNDLAQFNAQAIKNGLDDVGHPDPDRFPTGTVWAPFFKSIGSQCYTIRIANPGVTLHDALNTGMPLVRGWLQAAAIDSEQVATFLAEMEAVTRLVEASLQLLLAANDAARAAIIPPIINEALVIRGQLQQTLHTIPANTADTTRLNRLSEKQLRAANIYSYMPQVLRFFQSSRQGQGVSNAVSADLQAMSTALINQLMLAPTWPDVKAFPPGSREWLVARMIDYVSSRVLAAPAAAAAAGLAFVLETSVAQVIDAARVNSANLPNPLPADHIWLEMRGFFRKRLSSAPATALVQQVVGPLNAWITVAGLGVAAGPGARTVLVHTNAVGAMAPALNRPNTEFPGLVSSPEQDVYPAKPARPALAAVTIYRLTKPASKEWTASAKYKTRTLAAPALPAATAFVPAPGGAPDQSVCLSAAHVNALASLPSAAFDQAFNTWGGVLGAPLAFNDPNFGNLALHPLQIAAAFNAITAALPGANQAMLTQLVTKLYWFHVWDLHFRYGQPLTPNQRSHTLFASGPIIPYLLWTQARALLPDEASSQRVNGQEGDVWSLDGWLYTTSAVAVEGYRLKSAEGVLTAAMRHRSVGESVDGDRWMMYSKASTPNGVIFGVKTGSDIGAPLPNGKATPSINDSPGHVRAHSLGGGVDPLNLIPQTKKCNENTWASAEWFVRGLVDQCPYTTPHLFIDCYYPTAVAQTAVVVRRMRSVAISAIGLHAQLQPATAPTLAQAETQVRNSVSVLLAPVAQDQARLAAWLNFINTEIAAIPALPGGIADAVQAAVVTLQARVNSVSEQMNFILNRPAIAYLRPNSFQYEVWMSNADTELDQCTFQGLYMPSLDQQAAAGVDSALVQVFSVVAPNFPT